MVDLEALVRAEVARQLATNTSTTTAAEALGRQALEYARKAELTVGFAERRVGEAAAQAAAADRISQEALEAALIAREAAVKASSASEQYILDVVWGKFGDFFHATLLKYLDWNRQDYDRTLRDWLKGKFEAWK